MQCFRNEHADEFHIVELESLWEKYTGEYYVMDTYYRQFHLCCGEISKNYHNDLSEPFNPVMEEVEGLYINWFLRKLGSSWTNACGDDMKDLVIYPTYNRRGRTYR